jgi:hypothetical protein
MSASGSTHDPLINQNPIVTEVSNANSTIVKKTANASSTPFANRKPISVR